MIQFLQWFGGLNTIDQHSSLPVLQNVIMQMLSVYPDLLGEQAPPPAPATTIKDLPKIKVDSTHVGKLERNLVLKTKSKFK